MKNEDKDEFIVSCDTTKEAAQVYEFLVEVYNYPEWYKNNRMYTATVIACNRIKGNSQFSDLSNAILAFPEHPVYSFKEFQDKHLRSVVNYEIY